MNIWESFKVLRENVRGHSRREITAASADSAFNSDKNEEKMV